MIHKIVLAIDSFKGSLTSAEAIEAAEAGVRTVFPDCEILCFPISDGGEGILDVLVSATDGRYIPVRVHDPLMGEIESHYGVSGDSRTAFIEMASVNGLPLVPENKRNPMFTTTYGTGELIYNALNDGYRNFIIGIGGSATNDAGLGALQALGFRFLDRDNCELGKGGRIMAQVAAVDVTDVHPALKDSHFTIACDVRNPFYGPDGTSYVFARQKGADDQMIRELDDGMRSLAKVIFQTTGKDLSSYPGAGAAGGMGGGFVAFLNAVLKPGVYLLLEMQDFANRIKGADLIITGEGKADCQTLMGKVSSGVLIEAQKQQIPVIAIAGSIEDVSTLNEAGFQGVFSITPKPMMLQEAMEADSAQTNIRNLVTQLCRIMHSPRQ